MPISAFIYQTPKAGQLRIQHESQLLLRFLYLVFVHYVVANLLHASPSIILLFPLSVTL